MTAHDPLLTEAEAADQLRITVRGVQTERYNSMLGYVKVAGKVRIPMSAIIAYRTRQTVWPDPDNLPASPETGKRASGTFSGMTAPATGARERARAAAKKLRKSSATS